MSEQIQKLTSNSVVLNKCENLAALHNLDGAKQTYKVIAEKMQEITINGTNL